MKDTLQVVLNTPTRRQQPQMEACLSSDEGGISILASSIILKLNGNEKHAFCPPNKGIRQAEAAASALLELFLFVCMCVCVCVYS